MREVWERVQVGGQVHAIVRNLAYVQRLGAGSVLGQGQRVGHKLEVVRHLDLAPELGTARILTNVEHRVASSATRTHVETWTHVETVARLNECKQVAGGEKAEDQAQELRREEEWGHGCKGGGLENYGRRARASRAQTTF
jgi:hypothetical protein